MNNQSQNHAQNQVVPTPEQDQKQNAGTSAVGIVLGKIGIDPEADVKVPDIIVRANSLIDRANHYILGTASADPFEKDINIAVKKLISFGLLITVIFFVFFGGWAALAPLNSAAVSRGVVVVNSSKKTIQHLEGGIIAEIMVKEGSLVQKGDPLIRLDETNAKARQGLIDGQFIAIEAAEARLRAERDGSDVITFPESLWNRKDESNVSMVLDGEQRLFETRTNALSGHLNILDQRVNQLNDEISGLDAQEKAARDQLTLIKEEVAVVDKLLQNGNANRPRLLALQRKQAELEGSRGQYLSLIAKAKQTIAETELEKINTRNTYLNEVVQQLREAQDKLADLQERKRASDDIMNRILVVAPQSGTVTGLKFHTVGGVVSPGTPILDIVPQNDTLIIEAMVHPQDIDVVHVGLKARVRLTAFKSRNVPVLEGDVTYISADRFVDDKTGMPFYKAHINITEETFKSLTDESVELYPGMPADVLIVTGERTFLSYLMSPITDNFAKAFKEQ